MALLRRLLQLLALWTAQVAGDGYPCKSIDDCAYFGCKWVVQKSRAAGVQKLNAASVTDMKAFRRGKGFLYCTQHCGFHVGQDFYTCPLPPPKCLAKAGFYCRSVMDRPAGLNLASCSRARPLHH